MIVVDTTVWIDYLRTRRSSLGDELIKLIDDGRVALVGVVLAELLRGLRDQNDRERLESQFRGVTFLEMTRAAWRRAGIVSADLDRRGEPIPPSDVFIAALTIEGDHELLTRDKHFDRIPDLRLHKPEGAPDA